MFGHGYLLYGNKKFIPKVFVGIIFEFDVDPEHFIPLVDPDAEENLVNNSQGFKTATIDDISPLEFESGTEETPVEVNTTNNNTEGE